MWQFFSDNGDQVKMLFVQHIQLCALALGIALVVALPIGVLISRYRFLYVPIIGLFGAVYTIPSLALFSLLVPFVGLGTTPALIALVVYAQFILIRNIVTGLRGVDTAVVEAARGMGMSALQILLRVEFPLALPVVVAGLRIATVTVIAVATVATYISAGGLGDLLREGVQLTANLQQRELEAATLALAVLAIGADLILRLFETLATRLAGRAT